MIRPRTIIHTEASLGWGGQEIRVFTEMQALRARGHRLLLVAPVRSRIHAAASAAGFEVRDLDDRKPAYPRTILRLRRWFRATGAEVVNPHSSRDGWLAGIAGRLAGVRCILRSRHIEVDYPNRLVSRIAYGRLPHHVLTTSRRISSRLVSELGLDPGRVSGMPTGIDLDRYHPGVEAAPDLPTSGPVVGMISVLRSWKGHEYFLQAVRQLAPRWPQTAFVVAGEGPMRGRIETRIRELGLTGRVRLLGHRDDVPAVLSGLDILVLPSYAHEGVPQIVLQAQAQARAVVGTTIGGIPEVVEDGLTGLLVPPRDPAALATAVEGLLADPARRRRLGLAARERAVREYGLEVMCTRLEAIYDHYLGPAS